MAKTAKNNAFLTAIAVLALSFIIPALPAKAAAGPTILAPIQGSTLQVPLNVAVAYRWTAVPNAVNYRFQLDYFNYSTNAWVMLFNYNRGNFTGNSALTYNKTAPFRVRVNATLADGTQTNFSPYTFFNVVSPATLTLAKDATSPTVATVPGAQNVVLAKFVTKANGSNMELRKLSLAIANSGAQNLSGNVTVQVDGITVYTVPAGAISKLNASPTALNLALYPLIKDGQNSYLTILGNIDVQVAATNNYQAYADVTQVKRITTNDIVDPGVAQVSGNIIGVQVASLNVANLATPVAQSVVAGTSGFTLAKIELNAGTSGEDIRVISLSFTDTLGGGAAYNNIANLKLTDEAGAVIATNNSTVLNANQVIFNFTNPVLAARPTPRVLTLKGDVINGVFGGTHRFAVVSSTQIVAYGATTGNVATIGSLIGAGQTMTIAAPGSLSVVLVSGVNGSPAIDQLVKIGDINNNVFAFQLTANNEAQKVRTIKLTATGVSLNENDVVNLRAYSNTSTIPFLSGQQMLCSNNVCTFVWTATDNLLPAAIQPGAPVTITIKADIAGQNMARLGDSFKFSLSASDVTAIGAFTGNNSVVNGGNIVADGTTTIVPFNVSIYGDEPAPGSPPQFLFVNSGVQIGRFKIVNNGNSQISLTDFKFTDSGLHTGASTTYRLYYSDEMMSNYVANTAVASNPSVNFSGLAAPITLNGGSYRFVSVSIVNAGVIASGDTFRLSVSALGNVKYSAGEINLGFDGNGNGIIAGTITGLSVDGKPTLGTIVKL